MHSYDQLGISKTCEDITIATSSQDLSTSETWSSAEYKTRQASTTQLKMGRTLHRHQSHRTRILSTDLCGRTGSPQLLEHRASLEVLLISCQKASSRISNFNKETWSFGVQFEHPRQLQESLLHRLPRIPTFLCSLKVKGTANRVVGAKGHEP